MDDLDQKILAALAADSSTSTSRLGRRFKVARSTVQARIERMERSGVIAGYTVKLGQAMSVRRVRATVLIGAESRAQAAIVARLKAMPEVEALHTTMGRMAMIVQIAADSTEMLDEVLDRIGQVPGITETDSMIHLSTKFDRAT
ncbi:Lrp/AsnC family transcriptional regulator [Profundibacterium mesophilum]|uniref:Isoleucyl-tRNA synthetase n=1 Tax=Profundibacterium mesophilum KAUST100406-0324 TaxID=1037889 RepID=A0A921NXX7_9RHOB|nr:Lrp/AsnC family transcriptional regulator [Profundibacterium mesophilum]KAF0676764.1 isoleucyl-tRNA synthetase [Profundibacterium mesophilum KAUST100406-0324]